MKTYVNVIDCESCKTTLCLDKEDVKFITQKKSTYRNLGPIGGPAWTETVNFKVFYTNCPICQNKQTIEFSSLPKDVIDEAPEE